MKLVEQAIFTSLDADGRVGYRIVAQSIGVCASDARELTVWEPESDALSGAAAGGESLNFHPLPSGTYCVSRSVPAGRRRDGKQRLFTHCLIVPTETLARFSNNAFAVARAMSRQGLWRNPSDGQVPLEPFLLRGGSPPVDRTLLSQLAAAAGPPSMAALVQAACNVVCLAVAGRGSADLIAGILNCLPPECRLEFSFTTGLKFSPQRPFRLVALSDDPAEHHWVANYPNVTVLEPSIDAAPAMPSDAWSQLIERVLATDQVEFLATQLSKRRSDLSLDDLSALGLQLLESLDWIGCRDVEAPVPSRQKALTASQAHAAHKRFQKSVVPGSAAILPDQVPEAGLCPPDVLEELERLDDLVYEAISGNADSLAGLRRLWPRLVRELGDELLTESREQYLRHALSIWEECADGDTIRNPARAIHAVDVLCLLFADEV